jgi:hypothetical protein
MYYVTFGQVHRHEVGKQVFDKDSVASFPASSYEDARKIAFELFGPKFCFLYSEEPDMQYFPRGVIEICPSYLDTTSTKI